jgi:hypothetical protein
MYVVIEMFVCVGVMWRTSDKTFTAGRKVVAPNGDIRAATETKNMIHIFPPGPQMVYGGPETCLSNEPDRPFFSTSTSFEKSTGPEASSRAVSDSTFVMPIVV